MDARAVLGEEARVDAVVVERLDELPLHLPDACDREAPGTLDGLPRLVHAQDVVRIELVDVPRADPVVADVRRHRPLEVADDEGDLQRLREDRLAHPWNPRIAGMTDPTEVLTRL